MTDFTFYVTYFMFKWLFYKNFSIQLCQTYKNKFCYTDYCLFFPIVLSFCPVIMMKSYMDKCIVISRVKPFILRNWRYLHFKQCLGFNTLNQNNTISENVIEKYCIIFMLYYCSWQIFFLKEASQEEFSFFP